VFTGCLYDFQKGKNPQLKLVEWEKQYGETYGLLEGGNKVIVTSDLEILHDVFIRKFENFYGRKVQTKSF
jgi:cytochrome P450 family 13